MVVKKKAGRKAQVVKRTRSSNPEVALSREQIAASALKLIDECGLDAFSVRDLAKSMGVYPAAIYWHVSTRNDLLSEVGAYALRNLKPPTVSDNWKQWVRELLSRFREALRKHPKIAPLIGAQLVSNAGVGRDLLEDVITVLELAGLEGDRLLPAFNVLIASMVGFATLELAPEPEGDEWRTQMQQTLQTVNIVQHPRLARYLPLLMNRAFILRWESGTTAPMEDSFRAHVEVLIDGLEQMAKGHDAPKSAALSQGVAKPRRNKA